MIASDSRDSIIARMDKLLDRLDALIEERSGGRRKFVRSGETPDPYYGPERRGK